MSLPKVLIVEDESIIALDIEDILSSLGYCVIGTVESGTEAIAQVEATRPDLILMDINLKGSIDGIEAAKEIQSRFQIPIVYLTAFGDDATLRRTASTEPYGYILKPIKANDINATIKMALARHHAEKRIMDGALQQQAQGLLDLHTLYTGTVAHELRAQLATVQLSSDILKFHYQQISEARRSKCFLRIQAAIQNMTILLDELIVLSQNNYSHIQCQPEPLNIISFCEELIEEVKLISPKHTSLVLESHLTTPSATFDPKLLRHIVINLLSNAVKYSPQGGVIRLTLDRNQEQLSLQVEDPGIGIPPEYLSEMFQMFQRAANVGDIKGTGIGLVIVKQFVDAHGGQIEVESVVGQGTKFTVNLPIL
ncbi:ATP-binding protein [Tumidithrix elongata RA019]|uniref:histidine kinase n=1 Tax=Tumidithrix elongata BACA0141 TaxID=2716417 RepID=A0AAW9PV72_9CYAN|nr:ATP-binding protein [Tumidithrix elongata RA019]